MNDLIHIINTWESQLEKNKNDTILRLAPLIELNNNIPPFLLSAITTSAKSLILFILKKINETRDNDLSDQYVKSIQLILKVLPAGLSIDLSGNHIGDDGAKAIADVLRLNPDICIVGEGLHNVNNLNKKLLSLVQGSNAELFQEEKKQELTNEILDLLKKHPESIINFIKWLTKKTTLSHFSSLGE